MRKQISGDITEDDEAFFISHLQQRVKERKQILRMEIQRTGINAQKLTLGNSLHLRNLLTIVREFDDEITLIRWFVPVKLSFKKCVHIYVKHVEETKFAEGAFKIRTFFNYRFDEILKLLKVVLRQEEDAIKEHLLYVSIADQTNHPEFKKDYRNESIEFNSDTFTLAIDINGYVTKFHQK